MSGGGGSRSGDAREDGKGPAPAVFLDKDGTLIEDVPFNVDPGLIRLGPGAGEALRRLKAAGYKLIVVSNQSGVARGLFPEAALQLVKDRLAALLAEFDVSLDGFFYCPHHPEGVVAEYARACSCRKPAPGLILKAAAEHRIDLKRSWLIGDILNDVEAGRRAGCRTVLLDNGNETEWELSRARLPDCVAGGLTAAADHILCAPHRYARASLCAADTSIAEARSTLARVNENDSPGVAMRSHRYARRIAMRLGSQRKQV